MYNPSSVVPIALTTQLIVNHSLDFGIMLYTWCEPHFARTLAPDYLLAWMHVSLEF